MPATVQITFDAVDPNALARWWAALIDYHVEVDHDFVAGLLEQGAITEDEVIEIDGIFHFATAASIVDPDDRGPRIFFQKVPEVKVGKNRVHLDIAVSQAELDIEVGKATARGAIFVEFGHEPGHRWAVMQDPEGNEFCLH